MEQFLALGHSKLTISNGGKYAYIMAPSGQLIAFDLDEETFIGSLTNTRITDFSLNPSSSKLATID